MINAELKNNLLTQVKNLQSKYLLSSSLTPDFFEPGQMEFNEQYMGTVDPEENKLTIRFDVRGLRYDNRSENVEFILTGDKVSVVRDSGNKFNSNNFRLVCRDLDIGNMPAELCNAIAPLYDIGLLTVESAAVSYIEQFADRNRYAKSAIVFVQLVISLSDELILPVDEESECNGNISTDSVEIISEITDNSYTAVESVSEPAEISCEEKPACDNAFDDNLSLADENNTTDESVDLEPVSDFPDAPESDNPETLQNSEIIDNSTVSDAAVSDSDEIYKKIISLYDDNPFAGYSFENLLSSLNSDFVCSEELNRVLNDKIRSNDIEYVEGKFYICHVSFYDVAQTCADLDDKEKEILLKYLDGALPFIIAMYENMKKEKVIDIINTAFAKVLEFSSANGITVFKEDYYRYVFEHYKIGEKRFVEALCGDIRSYSYLPLRYYKGSALFKGEQDVNIPTALFLRLKHFG